MSARCFFDTTILIYAVSLGDPRVVIAEKLLAEGGWISVQVLNEFAAVARRKLNMSWEEIDDALTAARTLCEAPIPLSIEIHEAAMKIAARYGYHIFDALMIAAASAADCDTLYSEDMQDGQEFEKLTIRNPFARLTL